MVSSRGTEMVKEMPRKNDATSTHQAVNGEMSTWVEVDGRCLSQITTHVEVDFLLMSVVGKSVGNEIIVQMLRVVFVAGFGSGTRIARHAKYNGWKAREGCGVMMLVVEERCKGQLHPSSITTFPPLSVNNNF